ncbi:MAG TPA: hypothetical protein VIE89_25360, partial [Candidatus Binatia bacterium]
MSRESVGRNRPTNRVSDMVLFLPATYGPSGRGEVMNFLTRVVIVQAFNYRFDLYRTKLWNL